MGSFAAWDGLVALARSLVMISMSAARSTTNASRRKVIEFMYVEFNRVYAE